MNLLRNNYLKAMFSFNRIFPVLFRLYLISMYNPEELFQKGKALGTERDYRGAESLYRQIIAMGQNDPKVFL